MHLWRNLPEGQLVAVLRWLQSRREKNRAAAKTPSEAPRAPALATTKPAPPPAR